VRIRDKRLVYLQHIFLVLCLAVPAYMAARDALTRLGFGLVWYHRLGVAFLCLTSAGIITVVPGLVLVAALRVINKIRVLRSDDA
jgi:tetrahydromethanopterin S-methyltransferase subunit E